ncbi:MAG: 50S ribosomal protein L29 [Clostridiales bacterium]|nr:50S ribosomal protein L29 [Clostridiales bacterium]MCD8368388.1 50S ribosomal protein L29 [Clostridiales bacterium]
MKAVDVRGMTPAELDTKLVELKKELFELRFQNATNQLNNPGRIADVKKDIARVKTIIREKQIAASTEQ